MVGMFKNKICILHVVEAKKYCDKESVSKCECQIKCALKLLHLIFLSNSICAISEMASLDKIECVYKDLLLVYLMSRYFILGAGIPDVQVLYTRCWYT